VTEDPNTTARRVVWFTSVFGLHRGAGLRPFLMGPAFAECTPERVEYLADALALAALQLEEP
jgi:hypothetical protein